MHHDHICLVIMFLLNVTLICVVLADTLVSPHAGTVLTTDGGIESTVTSCARTAPVRVATAIAVIRAVVTCLVMSFSFRVLLLLSSNVANDAAQTGAKRLSVLASICLVRLIVQPQGFFAQQKLVTTSVSDAGCPHWVKHDKEYSVSESVNVFPDEVISCLEGRVDGNDRSADRIQC